MLRRLKRKLPQTKPARINLWTENRTMRVLSLRSTPSRLRGSFCAVVIPLITRCSVECARTLIPVVGRSEQQQSVFTSHQIRTKASYNRAALGYYADYNTLCSRISSSSVYQRPFSTKETILENTDCDTDELKLLHDANMVCVIDVRNPQELQKDGFIKGSVNVPLDQLDSALQLPGDTFSRIYGAVKPDQEGSSVVFHCRSGVRSLTALKIARDLGYSKSRHLPGGILAWQEKFGN